MGGAMGVTGTRVGPFEVVEPIWVPDPGRWYLAEAGSGDEALVRLGADDRAAVARQHRVLLSLDDPRIPAVLAHDDRLGAIAVTPGLGTPIADAIAQRVDESIVLTPATLVDVVQEIARAVAHAQSRGIVHGHLDPDHVLLGADGEIRVWGYGVEDRALQGWTPPDAAPSPATDVWSICAIAIGLVLGHPPFRTPEEERSGDCLALAVGIGAQWPALGRVLTRGLAPDPRARYRDAAELLVGLDELAAAAGPSTDRATLGATLWSHRSLLFAPPTGGAATAVPATDSEDEREMSEPRGPSPGWARGPTISGAPRETPRFTTVVPSPMRVPEDAALGAVRPSGWTGPSIQRLAPVLAGLMVVLLVVWLVTRLL